MSLIQTVMLVLALEQSYESPDSQELYLRDSKALLLSISIQVFSQNIVVSITEWLIPPLKVSLQRVLQKESTRLNL